jgi:hypothetical protein
MNPSSRRSFFHKKNNTVPGCTQFLRDFCRNYQIISTLLIFPGSHSFSTFKLLDNGRFLCSFFLVVGSKWDSNDNGDHSTTSSSNGNGNHGFAPGGEEQKSELLFAAFPCLIKLLINSCCLLSDSTMALRKSAMAKSVKIDAADPAVLRWDNKGEIISWTSTNDNGRLLRILVENGNIKPGMTAGAARDKYPMFKDYSYI